MAFVRILAKLLRDKEIGKLIVPIVPDEARTFGMEALFRQCGIYSHPGQLYEPVDTRQPALLQGSHATGRSSRRASPKRAAVCSFIAAGTAYANHGINMIPFFIYYSMFGFQRVGDLIWAAGDIALPRASCSAARPDAPRWPAKGCSTRTGTATCWRCPSRTWWPTTRPMPTSWR